MKAHEEAQGKQVAVLEKEVDNADAALKDVMVRSREQDEEEEARRATLKKMSDEVAEGKKRMDSMQEERK